MEEKPKYRGMGLVLSLATTLGWEETIRYWPVFEGPRPLRDEDLLDSRIIRKYVDRKH